MLGFPFLPLVSISFLLFGGGTFLNYISFLIFTLLFSPSFAEAPDYFSYEMWFNSDPSIFDRFSPGLNILIKISNLINLQYSDFRLFTFLLFFGCFSILIYLYEDNFLLKKKGIDYKTILLINSFPFILLSCTVIRQGISSLGVAIFIILISNKYILKNKLVKILTFSLSFILYIMLFLQRQKLFPN